MIIEHHFGRIRRKAKRRFSLLVISFVFYAILLVMIQLAGCASSEIGERGEGDILLDMPILEELEEKVDVSRMLKDVSFLSSEEMRGRPAGSVPNEEIARFIEEVFRGLELQSFGQLGLEGFRQEFQVPSSRCFLENPPEKEELLTVPNIIGVIPGKQDPNFYVVFAANFDGMGVNPQSGEDYPGADYNATGASAVLELARVISSLKEPPPVSMVFALLNAEECGYFGSRALAEAVERKGLKGRIAVVYLEGLGGGSGDYMDLWDQNYRKNQSMATAIKESAAHLGVALEVNGINEGSSGAIFFLYHLPCVICDWSWFERSEHADYHQVTDTAEKINPQGMRKVTQVAGMAGYLVGMRIADGVNHI